MLFTHTFVLIHIINYSIMYSCTKHVYLLTSIHKIDIVRVKLSSPRGMIETRSRNQVMGPAAKHGRYMRLWSSKGQVLERWTNEFENSVNLIRRLWISMLRRNGSHYWGSHSPLPNPLAYWLEIWKCSSLPTAIKVTTILQGGIIEN